jgi:hypothetical protein
MMIQGKIQIMSQAKRGGSHLQDSHAAEEAIKELQKSGLDMQHLSIIGKDYHTEERVVGYYNTGDRMKYWDKMGAFWGGIWGWLMGAAFFAVPGIGPVLVAGPLVTWIVGALEGAAVMGGLSTVGAGLYSFGIPQYTVLKPETALSADRFFLVAHGTETEVSRHTRFSKRLAQRNSSLIWTAPFKRLSHSSSQRRANKCHHHQQQNLAGCGKTSEAA